MNFVSLSPVFTSLSSTGNNQADSLPETDSGCSTQQLLFKIESRERKLEQQEKELMELRDQLEVKGNVEDHDRRVQLLTVDLKKKTNEVQSLHDDVVKLQELLWRKKDVPLYDMGQTPHGLAVVIVNGEFDDSDSAPGFNLKDRRGAVKDSDCFKQTFSFLQYTVQCYFNMTAGEMERLMKTMGTSDHSGFDSFVCCVSSHGSQDGIYGCDCILLHRRAFIDPLKSCPSLIGKPKMFFFQACRGQEVLPDSPEHCAVHPSIATTLHHDSDILIANASTEGNRAYTSPETGSWFANAIQRKLTDSQLVYVRTLQQILEEVTDFVSQAAGQLPSGEPVNQCVEVTTRMRKGVKFFLAL